jgi:tetratricopeptide (TPR) repeat protein
MKDFDHALELNPDHLPARVSRAELRIANKNLAGAAEDLDAADRIAPKQADLRFKLAHLYRSADLMGAAVAQIDLWIANHPDDAKMAAALDGRCWLYALQGQDLAKALTDCTSALRLAAASSPITADILDARGLVRLRLGDYDKSIADFDQALKIKPKSAWALYARGVAELRKKKIAAGEADIAAATSYSPTVADEFKQRGITP